MTTLKQQLERNTALADPALVHVEANRAVRCLACGHRCFIREGKAGVCRVRFNREGRLHVPSGYVAGLQVDPIEKKPFYHVYPGRDALSFGMLGCDLHCSYCQNWVTSQVLRDDEAYVPPRSCTPDELVQLAVDNDAPVMVSTYNEPLITADWAVTVFEKAVKKGIVCGFVSNGNATPEVLEFIRPYVSLYKVDLKGFTDKGYRELGCTLANVCESIEHIHEMGFWLELVTLLIPGFNDSDDELREMASFIHQISPDIPWHITAFHPDYKMRDRGRTPVTSLLRAYAFARDAGLRYVYPGNAHGAVGDRENTKCPSCDATLITRVGFSVVENRMAGSECCECGCAIPGVWDEHPAKRLMSPRVPRRIALADD